MKHVVTVLMALCLLGGANAGAQEATPDIPDGPFLPVWVSNDAEPDANDKAGEHCYFGWSPPGMGWMSLDHQIIVRDETDKVIVVYTVEPVWVENADNGALYCADDAVIPLPEAAIYQVFLNDQWITAYTPETLPTDPDRGLFLPVEPAPWD